MIEIMRYYVLVENPIRTKLLVENLTAVWEASVRATHEFLNENDIIALRPFVETALREVEHLIVAYENHGPVGFMGIEGDKLEMLFLNPHCIGTGIGKRLITKAISEYGVLYVDVNEQNPKAEKFYHHFGFTLYERTEADDMGNPFPVLKLKLRT
jgi:putative acetyltransferase